LTRPSIISGKPVSWLTGVESGLLELSRGAAGGDEGDAVLGELAGEGDEVGLVGDGEECSLDGLGVVHVGLGSGGSAAGAGFGAWAGCCPVEVAAG